MCVFEIIPEDDIDSTLEFVPKRGMNSFVNVNRFKIKIELLPIALELSKEREERERVRIEAAVM